MTWVVVHDPIPAGSSIMEAGWVAIQNCSRRLKRSRAGCGRRLKRERKTASRAYYRFCAQGKVLSGIHGSSDNDGTFPVLPTTRVEAMYAPEMFGELPNEKFVVMP